MNVLSTVTLILAIIFFSPIALSIGVELWRAALPLRQRFRRPRKKR